jgi:hypothetical protein
MVIPLTALNGFKNILSECGIVQLTSNLKAKTGRSAYIGKFGDELVIGTVVDDKISFVFPSQRLAEEVESLWQLVLEKLESEGGN